MRKSLFLAAAALFAALPAAAAVFQDGAVHVSSDGFTQATWSRFEGPVDRLSFTADNDNVACDHITVNYRDGVSHEVFSGMLYRDQRQTITFPEGDSRIASVDFACKAENRDGARISLAAESAGRRYSDVTYDRPAHVTATTAGTDIDDDDYPGR